ncbi:MAG: hypothetical protein QM802_19835 [Agriterribacter sp.]
MKIVLKFLGFAIAYVLPIILFAGTEWGLNIVEHKRWVLFIFIIPTALLFTILVNDGIKDMFKRLNYSVYDAPTGQTKTIRNPFWWWFIVTVVIQTVMAILFE